MSASAILISTVLVVLLVMAIALLTGSIALLTGRGRPADGSSAGPLEALRLLDRQWQIERLVYRYHRLFGLLVVTTSVFCLWQIGRTELSGRLLAKLHRVDPRLAAAHRAGLQPAYRVDSSHPPQPAQAGRDPEQPLARDRSPRQAPRGRPGHRHAAGPGGPGHPARIGHAAPAADHRPDDVKSP